MKKHIEDIINLLPNWFYVSVSFLFVAIPITYLFLGYYARGLELSVIRDEVVLKDATISDIFSNLNKHKSENQNLLTNLNNEKNRNEQYGLQIESISQVVGNLYKLSNTDKELLQKYSNIYFLNENYIPSNLSFIESQFMYRKEKQEQIHTSIKPYLERMLVDAQTASTSLKILSAYRSFSTQANLKAGYKVVYGTTSANKFSADQGYSEHQLGSTLDFTTEKNGEVLNGFDKTDSYKWLLNNAYKYGFVLSYPKGNKFFQFEPWHWRFVGVELATLLFNENKYFYDLDQREINQYLIKIFD